MENKKHLYIFISFATVLTLYLTYLVFKPFLSPILLGIIFSIVFYPVYLKLLNYTKGRKSVASLVTCLLVTLIIVIPLFYITAVFTSELTAAYERFDRVTQSGTYKDLFPLWDNPSFQAFFKKVNRHLETLQIDIKTISINAAKEVGAYSFQIVTGAVANLIVDMILMLFTMYYLFRDSDLIAHEIKGLIPLKEQHRERIFTRLKDIIYATLYGTVTAGAAQGLLGGLAFWALGIGSPVIWGVVMGLLALIPVMGAFFIWMPATIFLLIQGYYIKAAMLFFWGSIVISLIDNLIWPTLVSGRAMLHPLATFFSMLGGIIVFGPIGLFVGPFVVALLVIMLDILKELGAESEKERIRTAYRC